MSSMDKMGMVVAVAIVAAAVGFTMTGGTGSPSDIPTAVTPAIEQAKELKKDIEPAVEKIKELSESGSKAVEDVTEKAKDVIKETKDLSETAKEFTTSKLPSRLVSIPAGTSVPGCEEADKCYEPSSLIIFKGAEIIWRNDDSSAHTVTSGNIIEGPDGKFDSALIMSGETFSYKFVESGEYDYFCMIHPWANASVTVK
ncbi:protease inhibitor Kazal-type [Candidatus Nitrosopumilus sp. SW]|uniref:cupredoxin domain-containing protein n=1 Tax=Candidatus Nitrosopumilus sp. SW TaxID=2508726 RepID=UPI00114FE8CB|nr:plastocyanin/azurin family copper-binding protein [Candidatus Nitrosopumilus sp. SW]QDI89217.1 protease inhibitor Kazal-type [Candidatus Nitrosopumilus sp. SW]